jgi:hypothetical protein
MGPDLRNGWSNIRDPTKAGKLPTESDTLSLVGRGPDEPDPNRSIFDDRQDNGGMMRDWLMHILNPAHVYCRMRDVRISRTWARFLAGKWEAAYKKMGEKWV